VDAARAAGAGGGGSAAGTPDENGGEAEARLFVADAATSTVRLKVKVRRVDAKFGLPGITVEAVLQDGETGDEKETYRVWLALGGPWSGGEQVVESKLPVPYREGDTGSTSARPGCRGRAAALSRVRGALGVSPGLTTSLQFDDVPGPSNTR
jgi:hypothetical protein